MVKGTFTIIQNCKVAAYKNDMEGLNNEQNSIGTGTTLASASKIDSTESGTLAVKSENGVRSYSTMSIISVVMLTAFAVIYSLTYNNMQIDNQNKLNNTIKYSLHNIYYVLYYRLHETFPSERIHTALIVIAFTMDLNPEKASLGEAERSG
ncbi:hypothetical protein [Paenibacillus larvae]|uniref:hypothetical protein n=2 Tax=Paenibacillus larvae TaxID=1464 RepID=UPI00122DEC29|nr:hypothetical protein [Paenibacillus larvae]MCY7518359.1 hypothetical protein [Paenibacillus larvae]MCY9677863.1 hypothetical protein [Paenibacillus larvae]MCY9747311.1 hypothetical protein [Paenibacillus larvae]MDR5605219.1 hypothetical protein [Paenibacillus larvae]MEC0087732.1 hypothetical protein [Paenibacillus larvae]